LANQVCSAYTVPQLNRFSIIFSELRIAHMQSMACAKDT
jgi:hypothetical protein